MSEESKDTIQRIADHERSIEDRFDDMVLKVDRLCQIIKLMKWITTTAIVFALGSLLAVARTLYGMGSDDATLRATVEQARTQSVENKADIRELQRYIFSGRRGMPAPATQPSPDGPAKVEP